MTSTSKKKKSGKKAKVKEGVAPVGINQTIPPGKLDGDFYEGKYLPPETETNREIVLAWLKRVHADHTGLVYVADAITAIEHASHKWYSERTSWTKKCGCASCKRRP